MKQQILIQKKKERKKEKRGSFVWNNLPARVKFSNSVFEFKTKIKNLENIDNGCLICR